TIRPAAGFSEHHAGESRDYSGKLRSRPRAGEPGPHEDDGVWRSGGPSDAARNAGHAAAVRDADGCEAARRRGNLEPGGVCEQRAAASSTGTARVDECKE